MSTIFWDDRSPSIPGGARVPILVWNLAPSGKAFVRFLGPWRGVWLHWLDHSLPCSGDGCRLCADGKGLFWRGYAPGLLWSGQWQPIVVPVTVEMANILCGVDVTGLIVEVWRDGRSRRSPLLCSVVERPDLRTAPLPPPFDVEPILRRMWRLRQPATEPSSAAPESGPPPTLLPFPRAAAGSSPPAEGGVS